MAQIIGGIGASHSPTIGFAKDNNKADDPGWKPIFAGFQVVQDWVIFFLLEKLDAVLGVPNPHIYAAMRGVNIDTFQRIRNVAMNYSVSGSK